MKLPEHLASEPGLHGLQLTGRTLFALLVTAYFLQADPRVNGFILDPWMVWLALGAFLMIHTGLLYRAPSLGNTLAAALDLVSIGLVILLDPGTPPPTMVLLVVALLGAGLVYGLRRFLHVLGGALAVLVLAVPMRLAREDPALASGTLFLLATVLVCVAYFGLMTYRNQVLARQARDATWRDPDTGLISHNAMISTAGWLVPMHDRLSTHLSLALLRPDQPANLKELADQVATRLRRSDIAARYNRETLALLLPDTRAADAEGILAEVRRVAPGCRAALITVTSPEHSLEEVLEHLRHTLARAGDDTGHWLVHATGL